jgi:mitochondrial enoyl-[acyl-carrier protein] reductase / trans-2-enoyl-CoA reductase
MIYSQLFHETFADDYNVVKIKETDIKKLDNDELVLKVLYSPINPADLNRIEGRYGIQPPMPAVLGNEGVCQVVEVGKGVKKFKIDDLVLFPFGLQFWSEYLVAPENKLIKLPKEIDHQQAAMLSVNPATAYRMLTDFAKLEEGDWVVLNAANSSVGSLLIQLIKHFKCHSYCFFRRKEAKEDLKSLGADIVVLEDENLELKRIRKDFKNLFRAKLGLNAVGGESAERVYKLLGKHATCLSYGAMAKEPIKIGFSSLAFKQITFQGFWITQWLAEKEFDQINEMYQKLAALFIDGTLKIPVQAVYSFRDYSKAIEAAAKTGKKGKILLRF